MEYEGTASTPPIMASRVTQTGQIDTLRSHIERLHANIDHLAARLIPVTRSEPEMDVALVESPPDSEFASLVQQIDSAINRLHRLENGLVL